MAYKPGDVISNRYRILEKLGQGAHGVVYRARDLETRGELALKFLGDGKGLDPELSRRMEREATAMARLRGTSAVYVHGISTAQDGMLYVAMEMLYGKDFEDYLLDASTLTTDGMIAGTPSYIAPEAWRGTSKTLDHRIDVYALGVIVFRALSGKLPPPSSNLLEICQWATTGKRPSLHAQRTSLPAAIDPWVQQVLAIEPNQRFQSVGEAFGALEAILAVRPAAPY
jgi:serine/threonine protein kinase